MRDIESRSLRRQIRDISEMWKSGYILVMALLLGSGDFLKLERHLVADRTNVTACVLPKACDVPGFTNWYKVGRYCVSYFSWSRNFTAAEFNCRKQAPGGHLVSVHSKENNDQLLCLVRKLNPRNLRFWLGAFELFQSGQFLWLDGSYWNYQIWTRGEPNHMFTSTEECVEMNWKEVGRWNDDSCKVRKSYFCAFKQKNMLDIDMEDMEKLI